MADGALGMADVKEKGGPLVERLKLALALAYAELCEVEQFAGTAEVLRPIIRGQRVCDWEDPEWPALMSGIEAEVAEAEQIDKGDGQ